MFGSDNGGNNVLALSECSKFHTPSSQARATADRRGLVHRRRRLAGRSDRQLSPRREREPGGRERQRRRRRLRGVPGGNRRLRRRRHLRPRRQLPGDVEHEPSRLRRRRIRGRLRDRARFARTSTSGRVDGIDLARLGRAFGAATGDHSATTQRPTSIVTARWTGRTLRCWRRSSENNWGPETSL